MTAYLGPAGGLTPVDFTSSEPESVEPRVTYSKALSGSVTAQIGPRPRRQWSVSADWITPSEWAVVHQMAAGGYGHRPLVWYSDTATVTNILTPAQSLLDVSTISGGSVGGAGETADGTKFLGSVVGTPSGTVHLLADAEDRQIAVPGDMPLVASIYVTAFSASAGSITLEEVDPQGDLVEPHTVPVPSGTVRERVTVALVTSARTVAVRVRTTGLLTTALFAITLTRDLAPWGQGMGCATALIDMEGWTPKRGQLGLSGPHRVGSQSFTINELG